MIFFVFITYIVLKITLLINMVSDKLKSFLSQYPELLGLQDDEILHQFQEFSEIRSRTGRSVFPEEKESEEIQEEDEEFSQFKREHFKCLTYDLHRRIRRIKRSRLHPRLKKERIRTLIDEYERKKTENLWERFLYSFDNRRWYKESSCCLCGKEGLSLDLRTFEFNECSNNLSWRVIEESITGPPCYDEFCRDGCFLKMDCGCWVSIHTPYEFFNDYHSLPTWRELYCERHGYVQRHYFDIVGRAPFVSNIRRIEHIRETPINLSGIIQWCRERNTLVQISEQFNLSEDIERTIASYL